MVGVRKVPKGRAGEAEERGSRGVSPAAVLGYPLGRDLKRKAGFPFVRKRENLGNAHGEIWRSTYKVFG